MVIISWFYEIRDVSSQICTSVGTSSTIGASAWNCRNQKKKYRQYYVVYKLNYADVMQWTFHFKQGHSCNWVIVYNGGSHFIFNISLWQFTSGKGLQEEI